jgi:hypothetical protein
MNVSGQVMVERLASHAPSLHSLVSIITYREKCFNGMRSHLYILYNDKYRHIVYATLW